MRPSSLGPNQRLEPAEFGLVAEVDRPEVEPRPPRDLDVAIGERRPGPGPTRERRRWSAGRCAGGDLTISVVVAVAVGEQAEARRAADLEQRERLWERPEHGKQRGAARRLVGLRRAVSHQLPDLVPMVEDQFDERDRVGGSAIQEADGPEQQIRLPLHRRHPGQEVDHGVVISHRPGDVGVQRRASCCLYVGEPPVAVGDSLWRVRGRSRFGHGGLTVSSR